MRTMCSREIFTKKCRRQQIFDSDLKGAWHYNHVTFTPIAKNIMLYCRLIYMLSILCVRLTTKVKVGIPESFKVGWYPPPPKKNMGRVTLKSCFTYTPQISLLYDIIGEIIASNILQAREGFNLLKFVCFLNQKEHEKPSLSSVRVRY